MHSPQRLIAINKPKGYTCSNHDEFANRLIFELLPKRFLQNRLFCAGRLDVESEGLVIVTNDGKLAHRLTHPSQQIRKKYQLEIKQPLSGEHIPLMINGIEDEGEFLKIDEIKAKESHQLEKPAWKLFWDTGKKGKFDECLVISDIKSKNSEGFRLEVYILIKFPSEAFAN